MDELPTFLAHYTDISGLKGILKTGKIFATHFRYLEDLSELTHLHDVYNRLSNQWLQANDISEEKKQTITLVGNALHTFREEAVYIASFTADDDDSKLWERHCPKPRGGFSISFEPHQIEKAARNQGFSLVKCLYESSDHEDLLNHNFFFTDWFYDNVPVPINTIAKAALIIGSLLRSGPLLKNRDFRDEREWRLISGRFESKPKQRFRACKGSKIPYICVKLTENDRLLLKQITLGPFGNTTLLYNKAKQILHDNGYGQVKLIKSSNQI